MIRCWGGNVYEHDRFFDWCDAAGVLVWQDFAMACAIYPQDEAFQAVVRAEVRSVVRRLRQHPSLVIWAGDNECDEQYVWKARRRDPNDNVLTRRVIPDVLRVEDPSRPYLPSSPYVDPIAFATGSVRSLRIISGALATTTGPRSIGTPPRPSRARSGTSAARRSTA